MIVKRSHIYNSYLGYFSLEYRQSCFIIVVCHQGEEDGEEEAEVVEEKAQEEPEVKPHYDSETQRLIEGQQLAGVAFVQTAVHAYFVNFTYFIVSYLVG